MGGGNGWAWQTWLNPDLEKASSGVRGRSFFRSILNFSTESANFYGAFHDVIITKVVTDAFIFDVFNIIVILRFVSL